ncbi:inactive tyrosine-protein kinase 7 [Paramormyrops kingsleyae]|uniref:inactive tyrosine-protein kinase 7 n=1 Tax=Paramormyrops kingsleyae TaxID=1676925 RepID=UPI003B9752D0
MELLRKRRRERRELYRNSGSSSGRTVRYLPAPATVLLLVGVLCTEVAHTAASTHFTKEPKSQDALHGRSAMLRCEVSAPAGVSLRWLLDGRPVLDTERRFQEGGNLKFTAVDRRLDSGNFQCVAADAAGGEEARSNNASFNIKWLESGSVTLLEPATEAEIESSAPVTLRCHIDGHPRPTCLWFKDGSKLPERHHLVNNKERTLMLSSASPDDNGVYSCCGKNAAGQVCSSNNFTLSIIDKSFPRPLITPQDQVVLKNEDAVFHCQFTAVPAPTVEWYHGNEVLVNRSRVLLYSNGTLHIVQVKSRNTGLYQCVARGPRGPDVTLQAHLWLAGIEDMGPAMSRVFVVDSVQREACRPPHGHPEPEVWWERSGVRVPPQGRVRHEGTELVFSPTEAGDSGTYTCVAQNKAGQRKQDLIVTVATPPVWVTKPVDTDMEEGHSGYLHCHTRATPEPQVTWQRGQMPVSPEDSRFELFPNGTLRIKSVDVYDGLLYICQCESVGGMLKAQARVTVLERLKFTPVPQPSQCLELHKDSSVQCSATGREAPHIHWMKTDGSEIPAHVTQRSGTLHFSRVTRNDAGTYTCLASNKQGEIRAMVNLTVAVYPVFKLEPENATVYQGHMAVLHCQATGEPEPSIQWIAKDKLLDPSWRRFQEMPNGTLVITSVGMEDTGKYTCIAGNACTIRHSTAQLYVVEKPEPKIMDNEEKAPYKMIQTIGLSVGAAVAYIIVVLGLMFYCKKRRNAKRLQKNTEGEEAEMEGLNGGVMQENGQAPAEIPEEVALTSRGTTVTNKHQSSNEKLHFPRADLHTITTLGRGEFGEVLLAKAKGVEEGEAETVVLVKSLQARDEQLQRNFRREVEMFGKLSHPNVVRLLGLCWEAEPHYMILEYVDLGDLKQFLRISKSKEEKIKPQPLSTKQKVSICHQVAQGMEHLSNHRFVHKDLAVRNCLISSQRHVKVSALSLSKDVYNSEYYHYQQAWIPLRWLPAESVFEDDFSAKSDVWSFGVLMWEVFSHGELPYSKLSDDEVLGGLREGKLKLPVPENCPSRVYKLMARCWATSLKDRLSFSEVVSVLSELPSDTKV